LLGFAEPTRSLWWTVGLAALTVLLAVLEHGWQNLSRTRLADAGEGPASRERIEKMLAESERAETGLLVLRTLSQMALVLCLALLAQALVPRWWPDAEPSTPVLLACGVAFVWITLFCRVLPGELALGPLETLVRLTMPVIVFLGKVISPPIEIFRRIVRIAGRSTPQEAAEQVADEILATVQEGEREGHLVEHQADMIEQILSLREVEVRKLMTPRTNVDTLDAGASVAQAREEALRTGRSRYPLVEGNVDHVVGVVHVKDLLKVAGDQPVRRVMREPWFVPESKFVTELLAEFRKHRTHLAVVLDEYGGTAGVITIEDVLEEIVGEIDDEFDVDEEPQEIQILDPRHAIAPGAMRLDEVNSALSIALPESDDWDTLGGYIFSTLGRLPEEGEVLRNDNVALTVKRVKERRVDRVAIEILEPVG
jgi:CBS domain containing-hemolysin-like protein